MFKLSQTHSGAHIYIGSHAGVLSDVDSAAVDEGSSDAEQHVGGVLHAYAYVHVCTGSVSGAGLLQLCLCHVQLTRALTCARQVVCI